MNPGEISSSEVPDPPIPKFSSTPKRPRSALKTPLERLTYKLPGTLSSKFVDLRKRNRVRFPQITDMSDKESKAARKERLDVLYKKALESQPAMFRRGEMADIDQAGVPPEGIDPAGVPPGDQEDTRSDSQGPIDDFDLERDPANNSVSSWAPTADEAREARLLLDKYGNVGNLEKEQRENKQKLEEAEKELAILQVQAKIRREEIQKLEVHARKRADAFNTDVRPRVMGARKSMAAPERIETPTRRHNPPPIVNIPGMGGIMPLSINFVQQAMLAPFEAERGDDPRLFLDKYEKLTTQLPTRSKVDGLGAYLRGAAADWITVLERDQKEIVDFDNSGVQSNAWYEMTWEKLRSLFEREFAERRDKEIFTTNQGQSESGLTYFYRMLKLHQQSGLDFDEEQLATLIVTHMSDTYRDQFQFKKYESLRKLKDHIKLFDERRSYALAKKNKDKRKTYAALLEADPDEPERKKARMPEGEMNNKEMDQLNMRINALQKLMETSAKEMGQSQNNRPPKDNRRWKAS